MTRIEHDLLGDHEVPSEAYYGVHTLRALENFDITGISIAVYPDLIRALAQIKKSAALANAELGVLNQKIAAISNRPAAQTCATVCQP